jgi:hypothetical protein
VSESGEALPAHFEPADELALPETEEAGWLQFGVRPWAHVSLDGHVLGTTPLRVLALPPGTYTIQLDNPGYQPVTRMVEIRAGETTPLKVDLTQDAVRR